MAHKYKCTPCVGVEQAALFIMNYDTELGYNMRNTIQEFMSSLSSPGLWHQKHWEHIELCLPTHSESLKLTVIHCNNNPTL